MCSQINTRGSLVLFFWTCQSPRHIFINKLTHFDKRMRHYPNFIERWSHGQQNILHMKKKTKATITITTLVK